MKAGRAYDANISINVMGRQPTDPNAILHFSTDIYDAYQVVGKLQESGWFSTIGSKIDDNGNLHYRARFFKDGQECQRIAFTIPMAICEAAMAVINEEYIDYSNTENDDNQLSVSGIKKANNQTRIILDDDEILEVIQKVVKENPITTQDFDTIAKQILELFSKNGYIVVKNNT